MISVFKKKERNGNQYPILFIIVHSCIIVQKKNFHYVMSVRKKI